MPEGEKNVQKQKTRPGCTVQVKSLGFSGGEMLKRLINLKSQRLFWFP